LLPTLLDFVTKYKLLVNNKIRNKYFMYDDEEEVDENFKIGVDEDEPLDMLDDVNDFGLDEEDPDRDG
jgi:hypothetical protein